MQRIRCWDMEDELTLLEDERFVGLRLANIRGLHDRELELPKLAASAWHFDHGSEQPIPQLLHHCRGIPLVPHSIVWPHIVGTLDHEPFDAATEGPPPAE